jgi:hypothetical protein
VVSTHWHSDHVVDNAVFPHDRIVGHSLTRELMLEHRHSLENSTAEGSPAFQVVSAVHHLRRSHGLVAR